MDDMTLPAGDENAGDPVNMAAAIPDAVAAVPGPLDTVQDAPAGAQPEPEEETDEQWRLRFIEENQHLLPPRPERPPAPPPSPWDGPRSSWKVPDHLSLRHPKGGYMAMALMSRTMDDLDEVTKGERAATYEEVDTYLGHALIAEGLVPFTYTADEAIRWWKAGGYKVLGGTSVGLQPILSDTISAHPLDQNPDLYVQGEGAAGSPHLSNAAFLIDPNSQAVSEPNPALFSRDKQNAFRAMAPIEGDGPIGESPIRFAATGIEGLPGVLGLAGTRASRQKGGKGVGQATALGVARPSPKAQSRAAATIASRIRTMMMKMELGFNRMAGTASKDPYSPDNLDLGVNEQFTDQINLAARQSGLPPQTVAAIISAEAAKGRDGIWNPKSKNPDTSARGLTQFLQKTWIGEAQTAGTYLNGIARGLGYLDKAGRILPTNKKAFLDLRFDPQYSISAAADYAARNLAELGGEELLWDKSPAALARYAYVAHHEGLEGARAFLRGALVVSDKAWNSNVPVKERAALLAANGNDRDKAYRVYMQGYIDRTIDVRRHMIDQGGVEVPATVTLMGEAIGNEKSKSK